MQAFLKFCLKETFECKKKTVLKGNNYVSDLFIVKPIALLSYIKKIILKYIYSKKQNEK